MGGLRALFKTLAVRVGQRPAIHVPEAPARYRPAVGQPGKDAVWVPIPQTMITPMLTMAKVTPQDFVVDLGSGDGRIAIAAAVQFGARAMGVEYDADMVALSRHEAHAAGVADRATFIQADLFETDFSGADVITMYLLPQMIERLQLRFLFLRPGTRIVSQTFRMRDWIADARVVKDGRSVYLWVVPAKVAGDWQLSEDERSDCMRLALTQRHQFIDGTAQCGDTSAKLRKSVLSGAHIRFVIATRGEKREYVGEVDGDSMRGTVHTASGTRGQWIARRVPIASFRSDQSEAPCATNQ
ncbi:MAG TPA: class I SAM-dependent methyltransferase [Burkholderiales bacterium]